MMGVYKPREEASEWNLACQHFNLWLSSLQINEKFLFFSHPVCAIDILLWQNKLMQRDNERFVVSLFFVFCYCCYYYFRLQSPAAAAAKSLQSCPTLCDPIDGSPPGSPVPGILQARTLEWDAISFSNAWKWKVKVKSLSRVWLLATPWTAAYQAPPSIGFSRQVPEWVAIAFSNSLLLHMGNQMQSRPYSLIRKFLCQKQICHRWVYFCICRNFVTGSGELVRFMD